MAGDTISLAGDGSASIDEFAKQKKSKAEIFRFIRRKMGCATDIVLGAGNTSEMRWQSLAVLAD